MAVCILGMHRSGTSTITRAINLLGAYLGEEGDLMPPSRDNPEGFWERSDIADLHDRLLASMKRTWDTVAPLRAEWHLSDEVRPFKEEIRGLIVKHFSGRPLWAWKDPRACLLFPLWRQVLDELGVRLACVFAVRNPLDVARSLHKRDGFSLDKSYGIWFNHTVVGLHDAAGLPTAFLSYDAFLEGWEPELRRCAEVIGVDWPADETPLREGMNSFIRPHLRHSLSLASDLLAAPVLVRDLYLLLLEQTKHFTASDATFPELVGGLYIDYRKYAPFLTGDLDNLFECKLRISEQAETISHLNREITHNNISLAERERQLAECRREIKVIFNSMSWKVTSPFRRVISTFRTFCD